MASSYILGQLLLIVIKKSTAKPVARFWNYHKKQDVEHPGRQRITRSWRVFAGVFALPWLAGCALFAPVHERLLDAAGWTASSISGAGFRLAWFSDQVAPDAPHLHIYLGGDGRAFVARQRVAPDPTGSAHTGLRLALADPAPSAFLGRPCYYGGAAQAPCEPALWSVERYGPRVVAAVVAALKEVARRYPQARLTLVGYSGGGVVALLAARQVGRVERVVTIAAPLDTKAWTRQHGYTALVPGSNPAALRDWPAALQLVHLVGERDRTVPTAIAASFQARTGLAPPQSEIVFFADYGHECCWAATWPDPLALAGKPLSPQPSRK